MSNPLIAFARTLAEREEQLVRRLVAMSIVSALVGALAIASPASAVGTHAVTKTARHSNSRDPFTGPHESRLGATTSGVHPDLSPGCYGQTDQPHSSSHVNGSINVVARTVCTGEGVHVDVTLYRSRWYGWEQRGYGSKDSTSSVSTNAAESAADCSGTHDYLADSYHEASDGSYAYTSNSANSLTC